MLHRFKHDISTIKAPELFTWPFHYEPHVLSRLAAQEVQDYLLLHPEWSDEISRGKMFGVLVVEDVDGSLGFVAAFSGNLAGRNNHDFFVPPVYDMLQPGDFFRCGEAEISAINREIETLCNSAEYRDAKRAYESAEAEAMAELSRFKAVIKGRKLLRDRRRSEGEDSNTLVLESQRDNAAMQRLKRQLKVNVEVCRERFETLNARVFELKELRQKQSAALQLELFEQFGMLNARGEVRTLCDLFASTPQGVPPAGAGECAAPKMLQYAYLNNLKPVAMAEFWQGASPRGEVRHHGSFYPACNSKCKPILMHMMEGLAVEPNPLVMIAPRDPEVLWEDEVVVVINKPCGMLSVEGKSGVRSVEQWAKERYPQATGPIIVHRLDQSTSGILILAKDKDTHKALQEQFIKQTIKKQYTALLDGVVASESGRIDLAMRLDYDNRPRQMIAADGKRAITEYKVIGIENGRTRISFYPITGRTHQLRLHAAHHQGLNAPIVGDNIYGRACGTAMDGDDRLCLHASMLEFSHPVTGETLHFESLAEF